MDEQQRINGITYVNMIKSGAKSLHDHEQEINDLNVFPIPAGDTGSNMLLTIMGGVRAINDDNSNANISEISRKVADGMLLGARGNSGVILSQFFDGIAKSFENLESVDSEQFYNALKRGVSSAYDAVVEPTEGTILTVARLPLEAVQSKNNSIKTLFLQYIIEAKKVLIKTPEMLPVLKKAGVVDSGGAGLICILEGMNKIISGDNAGVELDFSVSQQVGTSVNLDLFTENDVLEFGYCTEVLLRLQTSKTDVKEFDVKIITDYLQTIGDSVAAFKTGSVIKAHVHTLTPYKVLEKLQSYGEFLTVKIENMTLQHNEQEKNSEEKKVSKPIRTERVKYATVTTAMGKGIKELFESMGADAVIEGGQTNNPSSEEFIEAFDQVNADVIFVLPNNSNIIMVAEQAGKIYDKSKVVVIPSKTLGQGYSAIAMLNYGVGDVEAITKYMLESMQNTVTAMVGKASRNATMDDVEVVEGEYIGFTDKTIYACNADKIKVAIELLKKFDFTDREYIIVSYGQDANGEEREQLKTAIIENFNGVEVYDVLGEQEVYDFLFILE